MGSKYKVLVIRIVGIFIFLQSLVFILLTFNPKENWEIYIRFIFFIFGVFGLFLSINLFRLKEFARRAMIKLLTAYLIFTILAPIKLGIMSLKFQRYSREWQELIFGLTTVLVGFVGTLIFYFLFLFLFTRKSIKEQFK